MKYLRAVLQFLYSFFIGDDWKITVSVIIGLAAGRALLNTSMAPAIAAVLTGLLLATLFFVNLIMDARRVRAAHGQRDQEENNQIAEAA
jgi:hypothetical protein